MTTPLTQKDSRKADAATQQIAREAAEKATLNLYQHGWVKPISRDLVEAYLLDDFLSAIEIANIKKGTKWTNR